MVFHLCSCSFSFPHTISFAIASPLSSSIRKHHSCPTRSLHLKAFGVQVRWCWLLEIAAAFSNSAVFCLSPQWMLWKASGIPATIFLICGFSTCVFIIRFDIIYWVSSQLPAIHLNHCLFSPFIASNLCYSSSLLTISGCHGLSDKHFYNGVLCEKFHYFGIFIIINSFPSFFPLFIFLGDQCF